MKKTILLTTLIAALTAIIWGQGKTNRRPMDDVLHMPPTPDKISMPAVYDRFRVEEIMRKPELIKIRPQKPSLTKEEKEELKKNEEKIRQMRSPNLDDLARYKEFLEQKNTGLFRLFPDLGCDALMLVKTDGDCENAIPYSWAYSFLRKSYGNEYFFDLRLKEGRLVVDGFLSQNIIVKLGDIDLNQVNLQTKGAKFLTDFVPDAQSKKAKEQFKILLNRVNSEGVDYGKIATAEINNTYLMRILAYKISSLTRNYLLSEKNQVKEKSIFLATDNDNRRDKIIAFRIIRKDLDGNISILWKELSDKDSPRIKFEKEEIPNDLKLSVESSK